MPSLCREPHNNKSFLCVILLSCRKCNELFTGFWKECKIFVWSSFFAETTKVNGWSLLLVKDQGVFRELQYENGTYPSNPSLLPKAPYDAPGGHAEIMFDKQFAKCKTYKF